MVQSNFVIYAFLDPNKQPYYIGRTWNLAARRRGHLAFIRNNPKYYHHRKAAKFIREGYSFDLSVLAKCSSYEDSISKEKELIVYYKSKGVKLCNSTGGGDSLSDYTRHLISISRAGKGLGRRPLWWRQAISKGKTGIKFSEAHKEKLSIARAKRVTTSATRVKMSLASTGKINIKKYELINSDGLVYTTNHGLSDFCRRYNLTAANLIKVLKGLRPHHKGWTIRRA